MIKAIVFDLWDTLGTKNIGISRTLMDHFKIEKSPDYLEKYESSIQLKEWKTEEDMARNFLKAFKLKINDDNIRFVVGTLRTGIKNATLFEGMKPFIEHLSKHYTLGLVSNTTNFESDIPKVWGIDNYFQVMLFSWQVGCLKPHEEIFEVICKRLGVSPKECILVDDTEKNILAAKAMGFKAIRFSNVTGLKEELSSPPIVVE